MSSSGGISISVGLPTAQGFHWPYGLSSSDIIAMMSLLIAFGSLAFTIWQWHIARLHNRISVRPALTFDRRLKMSSGHWIDMSNTGLGPAVVEGMFLRIDDIETFVTNFEEYKAVLRPLFDSCMKHMEFVVFYPGETIGAGTTVRLIDYVNQNEHLDSHALAAMRRVSFRVCFKSMYGEQFESSSFAVS
ncbi:hypothetical protein MMA231_03575 (plasmid) [Asticcacaulis sp. MM231]|uniref:hypothetical protein n=1 Tax=Asticcacaulis sp. MM231 TaxID=3157666 RepID=UPI0032D5AD84